MILENLGLAVSDLVRRGRRGEPVRESLLAMSGGRLVEELEERAVPEDIEVCRVGVIGDLLGRWAARRMRVPGPGQPVLPAQVVGRLGA